MKVNIYTKDSENSDAAKFFNYMHMTNDELIQNGFQFYSDYEFDHFIELNLDLPIGTLIVVTDEKNTNKVFVFENQTFVLKNETKCKEVVKDILQEIYKLNEPILDIFLDDFEVVFKFSYKECGKYLEHPKLNFLKLDNIVYIINVEELSNVSIDLVHSLRKINV